MSDGVSRLVVGCMTGTSLDGLDACLARIDGRGLAMRAEPLDAVSIPLGECAETLRSLAAGRPTSTMDVARAALLLGQRHAEAVRTLRSRSSAPLDLVAAHGQTVAHAPPLSWQLLNPWPIARAAACPVVFDLRGADLAAGGQGAPITPIADWILFRKSTTATVVLNLGGFCNASLLPAQDGRDERGWAGAVQGADVCACNQILDRAAQRALGRPFDESGEAALRGRIDDGARTALTALLRAQGEARRSLGSGDECAAWVDGSAGRLRPDDLLATAAAAIGETIGAAASTLVRRVGARAEVLLAGGGARNRALTASIARTAGAVSAVRTTGERGVPVERREALCMAVLGALCADHEPITLPDTTGVVEPAPIAGAWAGLADEGGR